MARVREVTAKPQNDAYTGILAISLAAMLISCLLLFLDYNSYPEARPKVQPAPPPQVRETPAPAPGGEQPGGAPQPGGAGGAAPVGGAGGAAPGG